MPSRRQFIQSASLTAAALYARPAIFAATNGFLDDIPVDAVRRFESEFLAFLFETYPDVPEAIGRDKVLSETTVGSLKKALTEFKSHFKVS